MDLRLTALEGIAEIRPGDDLAEIILAHLDEPLADGDVIVVTSKIVSKAAGLATKGDRDDLLVSETDRVVARRGQTRIVRTHLGLTLAAAGIDASNIEPGTVIPLPPDPDRAARDLREKLAAATGAQVGVVITDTAGRAWRIGQTDIAIGVSGVRPLLSFDGVEDPYGNVLAVTAPAVADEIAGAAELAAGKLGGQPVVIVRGLPSSWIDPTDPAGAAALIREEDGDLFGLGSREAVLVALSHTPSPRGFPAPEPDDDLLALAREGVNERLAEVRVTDFGTLEVVPLGDPPGPAAWIEAGVLAERLRVLARALRRDVQISVQPI